VDYLRGTRGASFEGCGRITRGAELAEGCGCFRGGGNSNQELYLLIKGTFCFVFVNKDAPSPKYAVGLHSMRPVVKASSHNGRVTVLLEGVLGDLLYEFSFENDSIAQQFKVAVEEEAASAQAEAVRKRLGHENLLTKRSSVIFAENIAKEKESDQPEPPLSTQEILANIPVVPVGL
jgi:hypothetical protein